MTARSYSPAISLWQETAIAKPSLTSLTQDLTFDVAIVGGGYTGLSTARYLAAKGLSIVVLEANEFGWGASGRNGGVVSAKYRVPLHKIQKTHGLETAKLMYRLAIESVEHLEQVVGGFKNSSVDYQRSGSLHCAHNEASLVYSTAEAEWQRQTLGERQLSILDAKQICEETGSDQFVGGVLDRRGGVIHPLNYVRSLVNDLILTGVSLYEGSPVLRMLRESDGVSLFTPTARIRARQVVLASNGYSELSNATASIRKCLVPFRSAMIATEPLKGEQLSLLKYARSYTETRRMMRWFRMADNRLLYGGRGAFGTEDSQSAFDGLHRAMIKQFPQLAEVKITHQWSGLVALTTDSVPHVGRIDDRIVYSIGYNGTGVAMSSYIGKHVAELVTGRIPAISLMYASNLKKYLSTSFAPLRCV